MWVERLRSGDQILIRPISPDDRDELGDVTVRNLDHGAMEVEVQLPAEGIGTALRESLRAAARELLALRR